MTILEDIQDFIKDLNLPPERTQYTHPQYIEGTLYLTKDQYQRFIEEYLHTPFDEKCGIDPMWFNHDRAAGEIKNIPIILLEPGTIYYTPTGKWVIIPRWAPNTIHIYNPSADPWNYTEEALTVIPTRNVHTYTPPTEEPHNTPHTNTPA